MSRHVINQSTSEQAIAHNDQAASINQRQGRSLIKATDQSEVCC